jgi:hypothetical protein
MSMTTEEYEERRRFLDDLKLLSNTEHKKLFQILLKGKAEFTENSNGIFFDLCKITPDIFQEFLEYMNFCKAVRIEQSERERNEQAAQDNLRY